MKLKAISIALATLIAAPAALSAIVFDFEGETAGSKGASHSITSGGLTMTITRFGGSTVEIAARNGFPGSWGGLALSPFQQTGGGAFLLTFSSAIEAISVDVGDFQPSDADTFSLTVGSSVAAGGQGANDGFPVFSTLSLIGLNSTTAILSGGSAAFPQSVFWDNITVSQANNVPVPASLALAAAGLMLLGWQRRRA